MSGQFRTIPDICHIVQMWDMWRKIFHVEKFQISIHGKCGYIWNAAHLSCGDMRRNFKFLQNTDEEKSEILHICQIQNFSTWEMWINLKFLHIMCTFSSLHFALNQQFVSHILTSIYFCLLCLIFWGSNLFFSDIQWDRGDMRWSAQLVEVGYKSKARAHMRCKDTGISSIRTGWAKVKQPAQGWLRKEVARLILSKSGSWQR